MKSAALSSVSFGFGPVGQGPKVAIDPPLPHSSRTNAWSTLKVGFIVGGRPLLVQRIGFRREPDCIEAVRQSKGGRAGEQRNARIVGNVRGVGGIARGVGNFGLRIVNRKYCAASAMSFA
jgi:hypothetical protein